MLYALVLIVTVSGNPAATTIEFPTKQSCDAGKEQLRAELETFVSHVHSAICVPKYH